MQYYSLFIYVPSIVREQKAVCARGITHCLNNDITLSHKMVSRDIAYGFSPEEGILTALNSYLEGKPPQEEQQVT